MNDTRSIPRYPLEWPMGWPRKRHHQRKVGNFSMTREDRLPDNRYVKRITAVSMEAATGRLEQQLNLLGGTHATLSTNISLNLRGIPRGDEVPRGGDPGAAIYFSFKGRATVLACDSYTRVADNIAALAAHIDAIRRIDRYGVGSIEQALEGYKALPADTAADWRAVFGLNGNATIDAVQAAFKDLARQRHPDITHDDGAAMAHLNRARDYALAELEGRA